jgi:hypothetical protein
VSGRPPHQAWPGPHAAPRPTPANLIKLGYGVNCWCGVCNKTRELDLPALVAAGKGDVDLEAARRKLVCVECGFRDCWLSFER